MKLRPLIIALCIPAAFTVKAGTNHAGVTPDGINADISLGSLSGKTKERVYSSRDGSKLSQLDWKYNNAAIIKGALNWDVTPWVTFGAAGWTTIGQRGGFMTDTDWEGVDTNDWTARSWHPNTRLKYANEWDLNITGWLLKEQGYRLGVMAGYKENRYSFNAAGGPWVDTNFETGEQISGTAPLDRKVIGYKQRFRMPYIGLTGSYRYGNVDFGGAFKYSGWVHSSDNDEHYMRTTTFRGSIKNQNYYSVTANAGYYITPNARVYVEGTWNRITNKKGDATQYDYGNGDFAKHPGGMGIENYNFIATAGLKYTF
ncbi:TPA: omptin family outer membrane protease [Salmonella enterica]|nr:omptin family outer membrane protease [Salmonella enterica]